MPHLVTCARTRHAEPSLAVALTGISCPLCMSSIRQIQQIWRRRRRSGKVGVPDKRRRRTVSEVILKCGRTRPIFNFKCRLARVNNMTSTRCSAPHSISGATPGRYAGSQLLGLVPHPPRLTCCSRRPSQTSPLATPCVHPSRARLSSGWHPCCCSRCGLTTVDAMPLLSTLPMGHPLSAIL